MWLKFLDRSDIEKIHYASLKILEEDGALVHEHDFLRFLGNAGAIVDYDTRRAKMPSALIDECIRKAPRQVTFYARDPKHNVKFGSGQIYAHPTGGTVNALDLESGKARPATLNDVEDLVRLVDALPNIHTQVMIANPSDVPERVRDIYAVGAILRNTGKNFDASPYSDDSFHFMIEMMKAVQGEDELGKRPIMTASFSPTSPLQFSIEVTKIASRAAKYNLPIAVLPCPVAGATSPVTLAGTLVQQNAEMLPGFRS